MNAPAGERVLFRRAAVAAVLGALALVCILEGPTLWEWAAYRAPTRDLGFEYRPKRASWLPGAAMRIPEQSCPCCQAGEHRRCASRTGKLVIVFPRTGTVLPLHLLVTSSNDVVMTSSVTPVALDTICASTIQLNGLDLTPETFLCPCCAGD